MLAVLRVSVFCSLLQTVFGEDWSALSSVDGSLYGLGASSPTGSTVGGFFPGGSQSALPFDQVQGIGGKGGLIEGANARNAPPGVTLEPPPAANQDRDSSSSVSGGTQDSIDSLASGGGDCATTNGNEPIDHVPSVVAERSAEGSPASSQSFS